MIPRSPGLGAEYACCFAVHTCCFRHHVDVWAVGFLVVFCWSQLRMPSCPKLLCTISACIHSCFLALVWTSEGVVPGVVQVRLKGLASKCETGGASQAVQAKRSLVKNCRRALLVTPIYARVFEGRGSFVSSCACSLHADVLHVAWPAINAGWLADRSS